MKEVIWLGSSKSDVLELEREIRQNIGAEILRLQRGENPRDFKPLHEIAAGIYEIRVRDQHHKNVIRCLYVNETPKNIVILHCFIKKDQKTSRRHTATARQRYRDYFLKG